MQPNAFPIVDEGYRFGCTRCGECCFDQRVYLEPLDVFHLGEPAELFAAGVIAVEPVDAVWRCRLAFVRVGKSEMCRFLAPVFENDSVRSYACLLHGTDAKPYVCATSPLARARGETVFRLVPPVDGCPGMGRGDLQRVSENERTRWSDWYQRDIVPHIETSETLTRRAFSFTRTTPAGLTEYLRAQCLGQQRE